MQWLLHQRCPAPGIYGHGHRSYDMRIRFRFSSGRRLQLEFGLWDPPTAGYSTNELFRVPSPSEASKQPGYESRISYGTFAAGEHSFQIGFSGYYSRQSYSGNQRVDSWAGTTDWRVPLGNHFEISGEGYRGKALGGMGRRRLQRCSIWYLCPYGSKTPTAD